jgi:ATP-dependent DNA ligase
MAELSPPLEPMLGKLARELPEGDYFFEPKWDGFRCLAFRDGSEIDLRSRNHRPLARYFPELVAGIVLPRDRWVIDGEIVLVSEGRLDFPALLARIQPAASRTERLARETPAAFVAFDLLAVGSRDLTGEGFAERPT